MTHYGTGRPVLRRKRPYVIKAYCSLCLEFKARDAEDAADQFGDYRDGVEGRYPDIVFEILEIGEE